VAGLKVSGILGVKVRGLANDFFNFSNRWNTQIGAGLDAGRRRLGNRLEQAWAKRLEKVSASGWTDTGPGTGSGGKPPYQRFRQSTGTGHSGCSRRGSERDTRFVDPGPERIEDGIGGEIRCVDPRSATDHDEERHRVQPPLNSVTALTDRPASLTARRRSALCRQAPVLLHPAVEAPESGPVRRGNVVEECPCSSRRRGVGERWPPQGCGVPMRLSRA